MLRLKSNELCACDTLPREKKKEIKIQVTLKTITKSHHFDVPSIRAKIPRKSLARTVSLIKTRGGKKRTPLPENRASVSLETRFSDKASRSCASPFRYPARISSGPSSFYREYGRHLLSAGEKGGRKEEALSKGFRLFSPLSH